VTRTELEPGCKQRRIGWPPARIYLIAFKAERSMEVWAANQKSAYSRIAVYPILAASGGPGPKRKEGDQQVPEGFYRLSGLNPQSQFHLSIRVDYPNSEDRANAAVPLDQLGTDIYIHGNHVSLGCLAMGDRAIERIFCLVAQANRGDRRVLIAPRDFRRTRFDPGTVPDPWLRDLYARIQRRLVAFGG